MLIDRFDLKILEQLQRDDSLSIAQLAEGVGLSVTPCWRRIQKLEKDGIIEKRIAVLNPEKLDLSLTVFVMVKTDKHNQAWLDTFQETVKNFPEIVEVNRLAGEYDYLLKVITRNNQSYDAFYKRLIAKIELSNVTSCFSMEQVKKTTELPLGDLS
ncbi:Lrp/AsnC family transcriptional regulator [Halomonas sp. XH26]|uniref:Lrp/AsnC family transcriptional regulator n=1 Tax=Vreelandella alkaliphila TaxID=272774 RepID=A0AAJ2RT40_9GAMM|nr:MULTISPECIES: Lrp/AsnC family transcriptional regulator [Halomonas]MCD6004640.1 Lrp/AsnC family transcriptional regulator [Halomonas sp. IOP_6]MCD6437172.1 Lrp/AsnC family transcriptional regulator [Halomonas sp.]MDX5977001.1 Lrp/AsnC family transcriptional regulator [Halomonas alkaliphila]UTA78934.1 Lrp/AsnC family transcriptional regulator [Halomonas sp. XH26]WKD27390.1 Lrp/AsnC family transcriptional regulator [Halomonas sp. KG2]